MLLAGDACLDLLLGAGQELGGDHHLVPFGKVFERPAEVLLAGAALVGDGSVEKVDAQLQSPLDDGAGLFLVHRPAVLPVVGVAKSHAAHADAGDEKLRVS